MDGFNGGSASAIPFSVTSSTMLIETPVTSVLAKPALLSDYPPSDSLAIIDGSCLLSAFVTEVLGNHVFPGAFADWFISADGIVATVQAERFFKRGQQHRFTGFLIPTD